MSQENISYFVARDQKNVQCTICMLSTHVT